MEHVFSKNKVKKLTSLSVTWNLIGIFIFPKKWMFLTMKLLLR